MEVFYNIYDAIKQNESELEKDENLKCLILLYAYL